MGYMFYSYAHKDTDTERIVQYLGAKGVIIWKDNKRDAVSGIPMGADWKQTLQNAIKDSQCQGMILQWSATASTSPYIADEIQWAQKAKKPIYVIKLDDTDLPTALDKFQYGSHGDDGLDQLVLSLPNDAKRRVLLSKVDQQRTLGTIASSSDWNPRPGYRRVLFVDSSYSTVHVIAAPNITLEYVPHVLLGCQFTDIADDRVARDVLNYFQHTNPDAAFALLLACSRPSGGKHHLSNTQSAQWHDASDSILMALEEVRENRPKIHVFGKMPVALGVLMGSRLAKIGLEILVYNDESAGATYYPVGRMMPE